jgi:hypothetical protein
MSMLMSVGRGGDDRGKANSGLVRLPMVLKRRRRSNYPNQRCRESIETFLALAAIEARMGLTPDEVSNPKANVETPEA